MAALEPSADPIDLPPGATIRRPDPARPFVAMSSRHRWGKCALSAVLPQLRTPSGPPAEEGTEAHKVAEWALHRTFQSANVPNTPPEVLPPQGLQDFDYSPAGVASWQRQVEEHAQTYASHAQSMVASAPGPSICMVEAKIDDVTIHGVRVFTVADVILWNAQAKRLGVGDYKYGRGPVGVGTVDEPNPQVAGAAALWAHTHPNLTPEQIGLFVYQPRTLYGEPFQALAPLNAQWLHREYEKLADELAAVAVAADRASTGHPGLPKPGDHCKYCPSARWCPAASGYGKAALDVEAGRKAVVDLSPEEVMALWASRSAFKQFEDDLKERVKMLHEKQHPAVQVKRRTGNRVWSSPAAVVEQLMLTDRYDLLQPPGIEKCAGVLSQTDMDALVTRAPDVLTYVASDGKQPDLASSAFAKYLTNKEN